MRGYVGSWGEKRHGKRLEKRKEVSTKREYVDYTKT